MKRRMLAVLMVLCLCIGLLPTTALAANEANSEHYVTVDYQTGVLKRNITVEVYDNNGNLVDTVWINDAQVAPHRITINLTDAYNTKYDIEDVSKVDGSGTFTSKNISPDSCSFDTTGSDGDHMTIAVYLCPEFEEPEIDGNVERGDLYYRITEASLLKLLHDNGVSVDENTKFPKLVGEVKLHFVEEYGASSEWDLNKTVSAANNLMFVSNTTVLVNNEKSQPGNIRYIEITYQQGDGEEQTQRIYSGDLRYVQVNDTTYEIESSQNPDEHTVIFYREDLITGGVWSPYDVRFVSDGESVGDLPEPPEYDYSNYEFVAWTQQHDGGLPVISSTLVNDDMNVFPQYKDHNSNPTLIHVMNNDGLLKERVAELFGVAVEEIKWDSIKITVHGANGESTNPDYGVEGGIHNGWSGDEYYKVYNYLPGVGDYENQPIDVHDITSISIRADRTDGTHFGQDAVIEKGPYAGDFSISTGAYDAGWLIELYINTERDYPKDPDPDPDPGDDYAITGLDKELVDTEEEKNAAETAGITLTDYDFPTDGKVIIPENGSVTLLYAITVTGEAGADFTVTDTGADLVSATGVEVSEGSDGNTFSGTIPEGADSITFYVSRAFTAKDLTGEAGNQVLTNSATVTTTEMGGVDSDGDEDTEETPAEEEQEPVDPDQPGNPDEGTVIDAVGEAVTVACTANVAHTSEQYSLEADSFQIGLVTGSTEAGWTCTVTVTNDDPYVAAYNKTSQGHTFTGFLDNKDTLTLTASKEDNAWVWTHDAADTVTIQVTCEPAATEHTLTYDANGGTFGKEKTWATKVTLDKTYTLTTVEGYHPPMHDPVDGTKVVLIGWSTTDTDTIYKAGEELPALIDSVTITDGDVTVYAVWGEDTNDDGTADAQQVVITPADLSVYVGGEGYEGTVDEDGNHGADASGNDNGLPQPGFLITLPYELNEVLEGTDTAVDLSKYLHFTYQVDDVSRNWALKPYGSELQSTILEDEINRFVYKMEADSETGIPARLQFTDKAGNVKTSDDFMPAVDDLFTTYDMTIYPGGLNATEIKAEFSGLTGDADKFNGSSYSVVISTGTLTIRGTTEEADTVLEGGDVSSNGFQFEVEDGTDFFFDESNVLVTEDSNVALLVDEIVADAETHALLTDKVNKALGENLPEDPNYDFQYLDLVDRANGNAVLSLSNDQTSAAKAAPQTATITWPMPADADPNGSFHVVHFVGLDREFTNVDQEVSACEVEVLDVSVENGAIIFSTDSFSPFALVYEKDDSTPAPTQYTVKFEAGTHGTLSGTTSFTVDSGKTIPSVPTVQADSDYDFTGWRGSDGKGYSTSEIKNLSITQDMTFTAQYERESSGGDHDDDPDNYTLRFESNGGTEFRDITKKDSFSLNVYEDDDYGTHIPSRPGYRFTGWYRDSSLRNRISESGDFRVNGEIVTIYAGWTETSVPGMLNGDDHYAYIQGYSDGSVRPNANITRAQVATIFFRLLDEDVRDDNLTTSNAFPDVDEDYWANTAISTMARLGVINGRNSGLFDPDANITRAEFAAICARFDDSGVTGVTTFTDTAGHWAEDEISRAAALGWIQGYSDGSFRPDQYISRAQAVTMINRVLCRLPEDTDDLLSGMNTWTDCHESDWFYLAIQEATNSHDFVTKDRVYESWTDLNRTPDWSRYE